MRGIIACACRKKCELPKTNKRFLGNLVVGAVTSNSRKRERSEGAGALPHTSSSTTPSSTPKRQKQEVVPESKKGQRGEEVAEV